VSHNVLSDPWKLQQLYLVRDELRRELRATDAKDLTSKLFDFLIDQTIERLTATSELPRLTADSVINAMYQRGRGDDTMTLGVKIRKLKSRLKERLDIFSASGQGKRLPFSVHTEGSHWDLNIIDQSPAAKRFWAPYFQHCKTVRIVYAESVFVRTGKDKKSFIRHMEVNDPATAAEKLRKLFPVPANFDLQPGTQFVSSGDCAGALALTQQFERNGLPTIVTKAHDMGRWLPESGEGVILLGNERIIPWLHDRLESEEFDFGASGRGIKRRKGNLTAMDDPSAQLIQGIVARTFSKDLGCWLTVIGADHGRFVERFANYLFSEKELSILFGAMGWNTVEIPRNFGIPATVDVNFNEDLKSQPGLGVKVALRDHG